MRSESYMSPGQTARRLGLSRERVTQLANEGALAAIKTPLGRLFLAVEVEALAEDRARRTIVA